MEKKHKCNLCGKNFTNGKALGGHMKSHLATLPLPHKIAAATAAAGDYDADSATSSFSSREEMEEKLLNYVLRENPKKNFRFSDPEFSFAADSGSVVQDPESETESKNPTRKRSKRNHITPENQKKPDPDSVEFVPDPDLHSSISETSPEEDLAMCLMMLSRDVWKANKAETVVGFAEEVKLVKIGGRPRCEKCDMGFRSQTALGGHKKICSDPGKKAVFQCPFCERIFGSGQALGGHKRSHIFPSNVAPQTPIRPEKAPFDLNLPAPVEDDVISVVSDT